MSGETKDFQIKIITSAELQAAKDSAKALNDIAWESQQSTKVQLKGHEEVNDVRLYNRIIDQGEINSLYNYYK